MSRTRIVKGKILKNTGGNHNLYAGTRIVHSAYGSIRKTGVKDGVSHRQPEKPELAVGKNGE